MSDNDDLKKLLSRRYSYFSKRSEFEKCSSCKNPCCNQPMSVDVSFVDIISLGKSLNKKPSEVFNDYCRLGIRRDPDILKQNTLGNYEVKISLELIGPCVFFDKGKCSIYNSGAIGRPAACSVFPEILSIHKSLPVNEKAQIDFEDAIKYYSKVAPCVLDNELTIERSVILLKINKFIYLEQAITQILAFGAHPVFLDLEPFFTNANHKYDEFVNPADVLSDEIALLIKEFTKEAEYYVFNAYPQIKKSLSGFLNLLDDNESFFTELIGGIIHHSNILDYSSSVDEIYDFFELDKLYA